MTSRERISMAQYTDDLGERPSEELGDVDIVRACGMAGQSNPLGLSIWRWRYSADHREITVVARGLMEMGYDESLVVRVLKHLAHDVCLHCHGRGYEMMPGAPVLSDVQCVHCQGTGKTPLAGEAERGLLDVIARMEREIASAIMKKLATRLDL